MEDGIYLKVRAFVAQHWKVKREKLSETTRLAQDLGLDGDDAAEFMEKFSETFNVDLTSFDFSRYFGPEAGFNPFYSLYLLLFNRKKLRQDPLTLRDLAEAVRNNRWPDAK